jgi:hypothetical protein
VVRVELNVSLHQRQSRETETTYSSRRIIHDSSLLEVRKDHFRDVNRRTQEHLAEYKSMLATTLLLLIRVDVQ